MHSGSVEFTIYSMCVRSMKISLLKFLFLSSVAVFQSASSMASTTDFNGDGTHDILYRSTADLTWRMDIMNSASIAATYPVSTMSSCCGWLFNGSGDFNNDGKNDVIIRNTQSGQWYIYNIDNGSVISRGYVPIEDATIIAVQSVADFNQDGYADVLLRNESTGEWNMTLLQNRTILEEIAPPMSQVLTWEMVDSQDYDGNGSPDILIRNTSSGQWYIYLYEGTSIIDRGYIRTVLPEDLREEVQGVADFDGDGKSDVLLRNLDTNAWSVVFMNGRTPTSISDLEINTSSLWEFNAVADYDADGKADISLRAKSTEQVYIYFLNGVSILSQSYIDTSLPADMQATSLLSFTSPTEVEGDTVEYFNDSAQTYFNTNISSIVDSKCIACHFAGGQASSSGLIFNLSSVANYQALNRNVLEAYVKANGGDLVLSKASGGDNHTGGSQLLPSSDDYQNLQTFVGYFNSNAEEQASNSAPTANAGPDQSVAGGALVTLDGTGSSDPDNDNLTYKWALPTLPSDSSAVLSDTTSSSPTFTADQIGSYVATLMVSDGEINSASDTVTITASNTNVDITNVEFTNRSGDCRKYVGTYYSNVTDVQRDLGFSGDVTITATNTECTLSVNEIPNHDFNDAGAQFASSVSEQSASYEIPVEPSQASQATELGLDYVNVVTLNGVVVDILAAACYAVGNEPLGREKIGCGQDQIDNPWRYDPMSSLNNFGTDSHNAHPQPDGTYHYHGNPLAMYDVQCETNATAAPVIGFAADGFPVYGPCFYDDVSGTVRKATSSYQLKSGTRQDVSGYTTPSAGTGTIASDSYDGQFRGDYEYQAGSGDLDECNGMTVDGQYGYYITDSYPWVMGCFKGTPNSTFSKQPGLKQDHPHSFDGHTHY